MMMDGRKDSIPKRMRMEAVLVPLVGKHLLLLREVHHQGGVSRQLLVKRRIRMARERIGTRELVQETRAQLGMQTNPTLRM